MVWYFLPPPPLPFLLIDPLENDGLIFGDVGALFEGRTRVSFRQGWGSYFENVTGNAVTVQGDTSRSSKPPVGIDLKVAF